MTLELTEKISTGSGDLNKWLSGGYERDVITAVCGPAGSGKTNFCMCAAVSQAKKGNKVIFIDTEGGFSIDRFMQIAGEEKIRENILLLNPTNFEEQWDSFGKLLKELKYKNKIGLIIVDSMTMLYRLELAESKEKASSVNSILARQMRMLAEIARKENIPILITNQVYYDFLTFEEKESGKQRETNIVGGDIMKYWCKCIIELKNERGKRKAILKKHRSLKEDEFLFEITNKGIYKKGWL
jgi:DNA repair protein RadB